MTPEPLDQRLHVKVSASMKRDLDLAAGAPGFKSEADVVRYALDQILPQLVDRAADRYAGRTRLLVDTAPPDPAGYRTEPKRSDPREPVRLRNAIDQTLEAMSIPQPEIPESFRRPAPIEWGPDQELEWGESQPKTLEGVADSLAKLGSDPFSPLVMTPDLAPYLDSVQRMAAEVAEATATPPPPSTLVVLTRENFYEVGEKVAFECWGLDAPIPELRIGSSESFKRARLGDTIVELPHGLGFDVIPAADAPTA